MTPTLTPEIATNVLHVAMRINMFPEGAMPDSEADKVSEADKIVQIATQQKKIIQEIGEWNIPAPQVAALKEVLVLVGVPYEDEPAQAPSPEPELPSASPSPVGEESGTAGSEESAPPPAALSTTPEQGSGDHAAAEPSPSGFAGVVGERWLDATGEAWDISSLDPLHAVYVRTGETTPLPVGFLKERSPEQPASEALQPDPAPLQQTLTNAPLPEQTSPEVPGPPASEGSERHEAQQISTPIDDDENDDAYANLLAKVRENWEPVGMPAPMDLERPPAGMPEDLTGLSDIQQRALHSQFNALASRARYLHGFEAAKARACDRLYEYHLKGAMREVRASLGKDASVTEVRQQAEDNDLVEPWLRRRDMHSERADAYKTFFAFYTEDVSVLSRDWTMRSIEERGS